MPESTPRHTHNHTKPRHGSLYAVCVLLVLWLSLALPLLAAEPVEIVVTGIEGDAQKNVQGSLVLPAGMEHEGKVDRLWLERFTKHADDKARTALEPFGYYNARVTITVEPVEERYRLLVKVEPGEPVRVTDIKVALTGPGSGESRLLTLAAAFPLHKGDVLLQQKYEEAKAALISRAHELGYLDAGFTQHEIRIAKPKTTAVIDLILATGMKYFFGETHIEGAPDYPVSFLRRHLAYKPGEVFSYSLLGETQLNFSNSERFKEVVVTPEKEEAADFKVPVLVQLKSGPRRSLRPGLGYGTDTGARFTLRYRDLNMFHQGHEFVSQLYVAERLQGLATSYTLPSPRDIRSSTTLQLNLQQEKVSAYSSRIVALELARNHSFGKGKLGTAYIKVQFEDYTVGAQNSTSRLVLPGVRFTDDQYDNIIRPHRGFRYALELRGTHQVFGSDTKLIQIIAEGSYLFPLPWRLSLRTRGKTGVTLLSDPLTDLPPSLRFFAGGDQSVRGYSYQSLGPRNDAGQVIGGKQLLTGSIELERALFKHWGVSLFYDAGNAFNSFSGARLLQGAGVGLHYYSPIGSLNLSLARQLAVDNPGFHIHFTVGFEL
jgi:translocation and assembly module TamA